MNIICTQSLHPCSGYNVSVLAKKRQRREQIDRNQIFCLCGMLWRCILICGLVGSGCVLVAKTAVDGFEKSNGTLGWYDAGAVCFCGAYFLFSLSQKSFPVSWAAVLMLRSQCFDIKTYYPFVSDTLAMFQVVITDVFVDLSSAAQLRDAKYLVMIIN